MKKDIKVFRNPGTRTERITTSYVRNLNQGVEETPIRLRCLRCGNRTHFFASINTLARCPECQGKVVELHH